MLIETIFEEFASLTRGLGVIDLCLLIFFLV